MRLRKWIPTMSQSVLDGALQKGLTKKDLRKNILKKSPITVLIDFKAYKNLTTLPKL